MHKRKRIGIIFYNRNVSRETIRVTDTLTVDNYIKNLGFTRV